MFHNILLIVNLFLFGSVHVESEIQSIEIFDIKKQRVVMNVEKDKEVQDEVEGILLSIDRVVQQINPIPEDGIILRIPLAPNIVVENEWIHDLIDEVLIFYPTNDYPYLLIFDQENRGHFFTYNHDSLNLFLKVIMGEISQELVKFE